MLELEEKMEKEQIKMKINNKEIDEKKPYVIAEIGINHNGSLDLAKILIDIAVECGCDAVKFQKRDVDTVYTQEELLKERISPFGKTNGDLKRGLELSYEAYQKLFSYAREKEIDIFASPWDSKSVDFLEQFSPCCYKVASASITDYKLLEKIKKTGKPVIISTGMSTEEEIDNAIKIFNQKNIAILACTSTYPTDDSEINLNKIKTLKKKYPKIPIGYSGHERDIFPSLIAVALGACIIERHITISKDIWGSDQWASLEPKELKELVTGIKRVKTIMGDGKITVYDSEQPIKKKLRRY